MLETLSCIFRSRPGGTLAPEPVFGTLPDGIESLDVPDLPPGRTAVRQLGDRLVILVPESGQAMVGFVLEAVPPATKLQTTAQHLASLVEAAPAVNDPARKEAAAGTQPLALELAAALGQAPARLSRQRLLAIACDVLTNSGWAGKAAITICRPGQQAALTLSSIEMEASRDTIADLFRRWRSDEAVSRSVRVQDLGENDLLREDTILLLDKLGATSCHLSLPPMEDGGFGFLLFDPRDENFEPHCAGARTMLELRHPTQRDWSRRRVMIRRGWMASVAAFAVFLLLPTDRTVTASGFTRPRDVQIVSVHFPAYLDDMTVEVGQALDVGAPIATLLAPDQADARASALYQLSVEEAAANAALAEDNYGVYVQARSRIALQQTRLQQIETRMELLNPVAGQGGRVVAALTAGERGRFLPAGTEIARIQTGQTYSFELTLSPSDASFVETGQTGELSLRGQLDRAYSITMLTPPAPDASAEGPAGQPVLVASALIETEGEGELVPGLSGFARIDTGRGLRILVWSRHVIEFVRMKAWTLLNWRI